jgi:hypothetical protein
MHPVSQVRVQVGPPGRASTLLTQDSRSCASTVRSQNAQSRLLAEGACWPRAIAAQNACAAPWPMPGVADTMHRPRVLTGTP